MAALAWNDFPRREPLKARALVDLANVGVDRALALHIVNDLPVGMSHEQAQRPPYATLARRIQICAPPPQRSGALALIGPPGSGKTTTLSKLAARYVLEQDAANPRDHLLADDERIGSHEQLRALGRLLGVRVEPVAGMNQLAARIEALAGRCVLIDTPGAISREVSVAAQYRALLERSPGLRTMLVLPASAQGGVVDEAVSHFGPGVSSCCALTRIDEAVSLGGVLSALVRSQLPLAYCCAGPRIPDDLRPAVAHQLIARAVELARQVQNCAGRRSARAPLWRKRSVPLPEVSRRELTALPVQVIAVSGGKGGTGKTSVAVDLATAFAQLGRLWRMLLDGDLGLANVDVLLGLTPRCTLEQVLKGERSTRGPSSSRPAREYAWSPAHRAWRIWRPSSSAEQAGIMQAFSTLSGPLDVLIIDTAPGLSDSVLQFCRAAQQILLVLRDEPTSLTDTYALIKVLSRTHGVRHFRVVANMTRGIGQGESVFRRLQRVTDRYLEVVLELVGEIPEDIACGARCKRSAR